MSSLLETLKSAVAMTDRDLRAVVGTWAVKVIGQVYAQPFRVGSNTQCENFKNLLFWIFYQKLRQINWIITSLNLILVDFTNFFVRVNFLIFHTVDLTQLPLSHPRQFQSSLSSSKDATKWHTWQKQPNM